MNVCCQRNRARCKMVALTIRIEQDLLPFHRRQAG